MFFRIFLLGKRHFSTIPGKIMNPSKNQDYDVSFSGANSIFYNYFQACIEALNGLQSNAQYIKTKTLINNHSGDQLTQVKKYLYR